MRVLKLLKYHLAVIVIIDLGKNHQWVLKAVGQIGSVKEYLHS